MKKILILIDWFLPAYKAGGPIRSVANLVFHLKNNFEFFIITSDRDLNDENHFKNIIFDKWIKNYGINIFYLHKKKLNYQFLKNFLKKEKIDFIYLNSFFSFNFTIYPLILFKILNFRLKIIMATRGMLSQNALKIKSSKKKVFIFLAKKFKIFNGLTFQASTEIEKKEIIEVFGKKVNIKVVSNLPSFVKKIDNFSKEKNKAELNLIFLSRISKKKNLLFFIKILKKYVFIGKINFFIYGNIDEKNYWNICKKEISDIKKNNIQIFYKGSIENFLVGKLLRKFHFYILPTLNENFGHSIFEAFSNACPSIISDETPWKNLENKNIGWDISLKDEKKWVFVIQNCLNMEEKEYNQISKNSYDFAVDFFKDGKIIDNNKLLFDN
ncbi:MAG: hypothetical protein B6I24_04080 [Bacteroidetes bacterium 4572_128]|nr:MAG: hypothetical protein B6I24_04080 [Bacteroidetes bacterium 4572_128]